MIDRLLYGWRVRCEVPSLDLPAWSGDDRAPDLTIRLGTVPTRLEAPILEETLVQLGQDGCCRFEIPGVAAYLVDAAGREVVAAPALDATAADVRVFLLGPVLSILCHRRGLLPLHASCIRLGDKAVAFTGTAASGKSVLAALFLKLGQTVLADDMTVIDLAASGGPLVLPSPPGLALWHDALDLLDIAPEGLERQRPGLEKYRLPPPPSAISAEPLPLAAIYHLSEARDPRHERQERLSGINAVMTINEAVHTVRLGRGLIGGATLFTRVARMAGSLPIHALARPLTVARNETIAAELAALYAPGQVERAK